jgi:preprotein translocase subunit SecF
MTSTEPATKRDTALRRLFTSQTRYEFVGRSRTWLVVALALVALAVGGALVRGLNFNIDFTGGTSYHVTGVDSPLDDTELSAVLREEIADMVDGDVIAQVGTDPDGTRVALVTAPEVGEIGGAEQLAVRDHIAEVTGADDIDVNAVGPRWGERITEQMLRALGVFLVLVVAYISVRFEWRMAVAALVTLLHDLVLTVGVYALFGFEVSPASVIALLTILGYSLYDTVVVFDRVSDDTKQLDSVSNRTYGEVANNAINQVLVRSISTSLTSLLPVGSLLLVGGQLLGADTLTDLALALFIGMAVGTYSSIFIATPLLVWLKEREPRYAELKEKVLARRGGEAAATVHGAGSSRREDRTGGRGGGARGRRRG